MQTIYFHFLDRKPTLKNRNALKAFIIELFRLEKKTLDSLSYIFCSDNYLLEINQKYLQHDDYTDIITFDLSPDKSAVVGEIYISVDRVKENAGLHTTSFKEELHRVILHGALHLCGYKDKTAKEGLQMRQMEEKYLKLYFS